MEIEFIKNIVDSIENGTADKTALQGTLQEDLIIMLNYAKENGKEKATAELKSVVKEKYQENWDADNMACFMSEFTSNINSYKKIYTPTGFCWLDDLLGGGLTAGLYFIGADTGIGKTAIALDIAYRMAAQNKKVLYFSLEMSRAELLSRLLSQQSFLQHKKDGLCVNTIAKVDFMDNPKRAEQFKEACEAAQSTLKNIKINELDTSGASVFDIIKETETLAAWQARPVVIVDYLQILDPPDEHKSDKQAVDFNVRELKRLSRRTGATILCLSSTNRASRGQEASLSDFKESGAIEFTGDAAILLDIPDEGKGIETYTDKQGNEKTRRNKSIKEDYWNTLPRNIVLRLEKNRNGNAKGSVTLSYDPRFNYFEEI